MGIDGEPLDEDSDSGEIPDVDTTVTAERRALLRDVEVKVMQYQDELENGRKGIKSGWTISEQIEHYRKKMVRKATEKLEVEREEKETPKRPIERNRERTKSPGEASDSPDRRSEKIGKKKKRRHTRSSSNSRSKSRDRNDRNKSRERRNRRRKSRSVSSSPDRGSKRSKNEKERERNRDR